LSDYPENLPDVLKRAHLNDVDGAWAMTRGVDGAEMETWGDATAIKTAAPVHMGNLLAVTDVPSDPVGLFDRAEKFYGRGNPWRVITAGQAIDPVRKVAEQRGMVEHKCQPGMLLSPLLPAPALTPPRNVRVVSTSKDLRAFQLTGARGFGFPVMALEMILPDVPGPAGQPGVPQFFLAYDGDVPMSTSALLVSHGIAGIFFVCTVPKGRKRGFATSAVWAAVEAGRKLGCDAAYLQATDMGRPVYERMGFHKVDDFGEWRVQLGPLGMLRAASSIISMVVKHYLNRGRAH
jgi:GNAT superfamily N-acetyltransferase